MRKPRFCYYIPIDGFIDGQGYRVSIVHEDEAGHAPTGTWPYGGKPGEIMPWFWGTDYEEAQTIAKQQNNKIGLSEPDVTMIVASSMGRSRANR